jgi:hypothetical protein
MAESRTFGIKILASFDCGLSGTGESWLGLSKMNIKLNRPLAMQAHKKP